MLPIGAMVAGYRVERILGTGGMGTVYLARNPTLPRSDALKVLAVELSRNQEFRARFIREADVAASLTHPNVVQIYRRGETDHGQLWIAMQFVDGTDAEDTVRAGTMTPARAVHIVGEIAKALDYAHQRNVVHRDVKPANFLLSGEGGVERVLLGDFGIARALDDVGLTVTGSVLATVSYAAPEVLAGLRFDHRADLYSLGCALFRLLTGKTPFPVDGGAPAVMLAHLQQPPPRVSEQAPGLPPAFDPVIATAMAKDPAHRFQTAGQLAAAATAALHGRATDAPVTTPWWRPASGSRTRAPRRRGRWWIIATLAVVALVAAGGVTARTLMARSAEHAAVKSATGSERTPSAPPVTMSTLKDLLLSVDEIGAMLGAELDPQPVGTQMSTEAALVQKDCAGPFAPAEQLAYAGSGWQAAAVQLMRLRLAVDQPPVLSRQVTQAVVSFPNADLAVKFHTQQQQQWEQCNDRELTYTMDNVPLLINMRGFGRTDDGILTMSWSPQDSGGWACARTLAVRNNIAIDIQACSDDNPMGSAIDIVDKIAARIPQG